MRKRDERFADRDHHTSAPAPLQDKSGSKKLTESVFTPSDFTYDADARTGVCEFSKFCHHFSLNSVAG